MHTTASALKFQSIDTDTHALVHLLCYYLLATPGAHKPIRPAPRKVSASWERRVAGAVESMLFNIFYQIIIQQIFH